MKSPNMWVVMLMVCLFLAPAVWAQTPASGNQNAASPAPSASTAIVPRLIKFTGTLFDAQTRPMAGPVGVTFALYAQQTGGAALWMETQNVNPDANGVYTVLLGAESSQGVPTELFATGEARWLGIQMERQAERERFLLVSVPYALKAADAESLGGKPASAFVTSETPASTGSATGTASATSTSTGGPAPGGTGGTTTGTGPQAKGRPNAARTPATPTTNYIPVFTSNSGTLGSSNLYEDPTSNNLGVGTTSPLMNFDTLGSSPTNGVMILRRGVQGANPSLPTSFGFPYLLIGGAEYNSNAIQSIGFGFSNGGGQSHSPGEIGFQTMSTAGFTLGDLVFATRNGTSNVAPSEAMRITSAGNVGIGTAGPPYKLTVTGRQNQLAVQSSISGAEASMAFNPGGSVHAWQAGVNSTGPDFFVYENGGVSLGGAGGGCGPHQRFAQPPEYDRSSGRSDNPWWCSLRP